MTEADDIRKAGEAAGDEIRNAVDEGVRINAMERLRLTEQVQDDRRGDAPPERELTASQVQQDRRDDEQGNRDNIQQDRRDDQAPERDRTTTQIREDRKADLHYTTDQIQQDRRDDEAPRTALELVRADKLERSIVLLEAVRRMSMAVLVVMVLLGCATVYMFDYMNDNRDQLSNLRSEIEASQRASEDVNDTVGSLAERLSVSSQNHERTQRLICGWYRTNQLPLPDNGDCDNR